MAYHKKSFTWSPTVSQVLTKTCLINLKPTVTANQGPVRLKIDTERELQFSNDLSWNWHKSWNIPNLSIKLQLEDEDTPQWMDCQAQLMAVKLNQDGVYEEVGLEGVTTQELVDGKAFFSGVKFNSTTYNHQGHKFHLIILLKSANNIITALESPPIFVDSRKSARDEHRQTQFIQPFEPKYLERNFCKKEKHFNDVIEAPIENNENGLHNYLTAPNIRNKIKHPLFLALKFSKCMTIYHLRTMITDNHLIEFQRQLKQKQGQCEYIIAFQSNNNRIRKKIEETLTQLFIQSSVKVMERKYVDETLYQKLDYDIKSYYEAYNKLVEMMNSTNSESTMEIQIEEQNQQQISSQQGQFNRQQSNGGRKSAFRKFNKDFDKLPTKNFCEFQNEDSIQKKVKEEEVIDYGNKMLPVNIQNLFFQEQLIKYYLFQQQYMINLLSQQI
ncbi:unnamed protein product (macronuclear) [Paramecium tetraurelia]|uniref:C2 NT-type domain-containing protein n=1 Tax=Paramecium tetraurelia TaxID=5888 RepID=A0BHF1_PARTE|nr:uncharacterized protein GSPATT00029003001 [Paramecium tetraurelia]CAK57968.1 unnamed protein product [Paramecium tetraurelia]|eukprot:XP_001425366.1 hypothetical protein (macronuclear) [Paramecium tetraurelia strain d4-2]